MKMAGVVIGLGEYRRLPALVRDDLVLWQEAALQREHDAAELGGQE